MNYTECNEDSMIGIVPSMCHKDGIIHRDSTKYYKDGILEIHVVHIA